MTWGGGGDKATQEAVHVVGYKETGYPLMRCSPQINYTVQGRMAGLLDDVGASNQRRGCLCGGVEGKGLSVDAL
jgi:hypothetical protein